MDETLRAYLAGILDGEGCVSLQVRPKNGRFYITPRVQVSNTDEEFIRWLDRTIGAGNIYQNRNHRPTRKDLWLWSCAGSVARELVRATRPWLRIKAPQADLILALPVRACGERMTEADFERNRQAIADIRALNRRGRASSSAPAG